MNIFFFVLFIILFFSARLRDRHYSRSSLFLCSFEMLGVVSFYMVPIRLSFFLEVGLALTFPPVPDFVEVIY